MAHLDAIAKFLVKMRLINVFHGIDRFLFGEKLTILAYHNLTDLDPDAFGYDFNNVSGSSGQFARQLDLLNNSFDILTFTELHTKVQSRKFIRRALIITFDDGYSSFERIALPHLTRLGIKAVVFLPTSYVGSDKLFWWDELCFILKEIGIETFYNDAFSKFFCGIADLEFFINADDFENGVRYILRFLKKQKETERDDFLQFLRDMVPRPVHVDPAPDTVSVMTWDGVVHCSQFGI